MSDWYTWAEYNRRFFRVTGCNGRYIARCGTTAAIGATITEAVQWAAFICENTPRTLSSDVPF